jgi:hypothetical protein
VTLDHNEEWLAVTEKALQDVGLRKYVALVYAPLFAERLGDCEFLCYSQNALRKYAALGSVDLCFIDGPPEAVGRAGTLLSVGPYLSDEATVLLDDIQRTGEQSAIRLWMAKYSKEIAHVTCLPTGRGLAELRWVKGKKRMAAAHARTRTRESDYPMATRISAAIEYEPSDSL